jgi:hypothetical protein
MAAPLCLAAEGGGVLEGFNPYPVPGCGGVATAPSTPANALLPTTSQMKPPAGPIAETKCPSEKGVSVKPCAVKLTAAKPAVTVKTKGPKGGTFTVMDPGCTTRMVATITGSENTYKVAAGSLGRGQCVATFVDYNSESKRLGAAKVIIVNDVDKKKHK